MTTLFKDTRENCWDQYHCLNLLSMPLHIHDSTAYIISYICLPKRPSLAQYTCKAKAIIVFASHSSSSLHYSLPWIITLSFCLTPHFCLRYPLPFIISFGFLVWFWFNFLWGFFVLCDPGAKVLEVTGSSFCRSRNILITILFLQTFITFVLHVSSYHTSWVSLNLPITVCMPLLYVNRLSLLTCKSHGSGNW